MCRSKNIVSFYFSVYWLAYILGNTYSDLLFGKAFQQNY